MERMGKLTAEQHAKIAAVEKLDDFFKAIDEIVRDYETKHKKQDENI